MAVFAAPAVATLLAPEHVLALGGAMFVAGAALMSGGNLLGLLMLMPGVLLVLAGVTFRPAREAPVWMRLIGNTAALVLAMYLATQPGSHHLADRDGPRLCHLGSELEGDAPSDLDELTGGEALTHSPP